MQGKKEYQEKLFVNFRLSERVPQGNFYRRLKETLDLSYLHKMTENYYGTEGQKSIDTAVFFKLMLIGYLENINSDRKILEQASMRMDMLYFLGYEIDEPLPWHSTLSRTRKLLGEEVFLELFRDILRRCAEKGMVEGETQSLDSAFIKANASMDSMVEIGLNKDIKGYLDTLTANEKEAVENEREKEISKKKENEKSRSKKKYNERFVSTTDADARLSQKRGKIPALNHLGIISVDTKSHIICGAVVDFANKRDSDTTEKIVGQTIKNLREVNIGVKEVLADKGYSSGTTYKYLESQNITAYIPVHSGYKAEREGFTYNEAEDFYLCSQGVKLTFKCLKRQKNRKTINKTYTTTVSDCRHCSLKQQCCKKLSYKEIHNSVDKPYYDKAYKLLNSRKGKQKMRLRSATVEPVWGTLLNFRRMKKVYTKGNDLANKQLLMASAAYNLKKLMNFKIKPTANAIKNSVISLKSTALDLCQIFGALKIYFVQFRLQYTL